MKIVNAMAAFAAAVLVCAGAASAQDVSLPANFGDVRLQSGFTPDPYVVNVVAGGTTDAYTETNLPGECVGAITDAPDFRVRFEPGKNGLPLAFRTVSSSDTTLIINAPDGRWHCDDDSFGDRDAQVVFRRPGSGTYDIWVGVLGGGTAEAVLGVTETP